MRQMALTNKILEINTGSHLYGTNTPTSDIDRVGVFIPDLEYYFGLKTVEEVDLSITSKDENGKNNKDAEDFKLYSINKFIKLLMENNPNILEMVFVNKENTLFVDSYGKAILDNKHLFPWKGLVNKFISYSISQVHKMQIKVTNYDSFVEAEKWLQDKLYIRNETTNYEASRLLAEFRTTGIPGVKFYDHHATIGDINISLTDKLSKVYNKVVDRKSKVGNREELYTKYGYDVKFGMHVVRLLLEGKELMETGELQFPLKDKELLLDIRNGKWQKEDIVKFADELKKEMDDKVKDNKILPDKPNYNEIEQLLINTNMSFHFK